MAKGKKYEGGKAVLTKNDLDWLKDAEATITAIKERIRLEGGKKERTKQELQVQIERKRKLMEEVAKIENGRIQAAIIFRYLCKYSWRETAQKIGMGDSESSIRMAITRYLQEEGRKK